MLITENGDNSFDKLIDSLSNKFDKLMDYIRSSDISKLT